MTGTAPTEAAEFGEIYKLDVVAIPTNQSMIRKDEDDEVYRTADEKTEAIVARDRRPRTRRASRSLVGTVSIEKSEALADAAEEARHPAPGAERPLPRAGGLDHRPGRPGRAR